MVAVLRQEVIVPAEELVGHGFDDTPKILLRSHRKAVEDPLAKGAARRFCAGFCPVDAGDMGVVMPAVGVFAVPKDKPGMKKAGSDGPEHIGQSTGLAGRQ
jgi:hypothetical protein